MLDASALVGALLDGPRYPRVLELLAEEGADVVVPYVCDVEVLSVVRRAVRLVPADEGRVRQALDIYLELPLRRLEHEPLLARAFAYRDNFTAYDAMYVVLAEALGASLVTADLRLARATREWTDVTVVEV